MDASLAGLFQFGMYAADDPKIVATMEAVRERLWVRTDVGGLARYENDYYHQISTDIAQVPGNPWFICTLWLADWYIAKARNRADSGAGPGYSAVGSEECATEWGACRADPPL